MPSERADARHQTQAAAAVVAALAVYLGDALNLGLPNPLLGVAVGGVLALAPGGRKLGRLAGFLVGVAASGCARPQARAHQ